MQAHSIQALPKNDDVKPNSSISEIKLTSLPTIKNPSSSSLRLIPKFDEDGFRFFFLSRPKRFGKTIFLQMLYRFLNGDSSYFRNITIYNRGNKVKKDGMWISYPVIYIDFSAMTVFETLLSDAKEFIRRFLENLTKKLTEIGARYGLTSSTGTYRSVTKLIDDMEQKYQLPVSILVDEYDEPLSTSVLSKKTEKQLIY
jgi:hypothetical protein